MKVREPDAAARAAAQYEQTLKNQREVAGFPNEPTTFGEIAGEYMRIAEKARPEPPSPGHTALWHFLARHVTRYDVTVEELARVTTGHGTVRTLAAVVKAPDGVRYGIDIYDGEDGLREDDAALFVLHGDLAEVWHVPESAMRRETAGALARFVRTHWALFNRTSTEEAFKQAGILTSPRFLPVTVEGWYEMPRPLRSKHRVRGLLRINPRERR